MRRSKKPVAVDKTPGLLLRNLRFKVGLEQKEFARKIGCSSALVSKWETHNMKIANPIHVKKIIDIFKKYGIELKVEDLRPDLTL